MRCVVCWSVVAVLNQTLAMTELKPGCLAHKARSGSSSIVIESTWLPASARSHCLALRDCFQHESLESEARRYQSHALILSVPAICRPQIGLVTPSQAVRIFFRPRKTPNLVSRPEAAPFSQLPKHNDGIRGRGALSGNMEM